MDIALELLNELTQDGRMLWVVGGGSVVSENDSRGIKEPDVHGSNVTIEADNWHCHLDLDTVTGIQFVQAIAHGDLLCYYVRFSNDDQEETLLRSYFPNPYLDDDFNRTELQPEKLQAFRDFRDRYVGRHGIVFVNRSAQPSA